jgi:hypothetical protein
VQNCGGYRVFIRDYLQINWRQGWYGLFFIDGNLPTGCISGVLQMKERQEERGLEK